MRCAADAASYITLGRIRNAWIYMVPNIFTNFTETEIDVCIGVPEHLAADAFQISVPSCVFFPVGFFIMLGTIQLDYDFG